MTLPEEIFSLLDTDLYKLTMQCAILKYLPDISESHPLAASTDGLLVCYGRRHLCLHKPDTGDATEPGSLSVATGTGR